MDDTLCPRCRSPLFHDAEETPDGNVAVHPVCSACNWEPLALYSEYPMCGAESAKAEALATLEADLAPLAWFEPRDHLPTDEEVQALRRRHGAGAGWMIRSTDSATPRSYSRPVFLEGDSDLLPGLRRMVSEGIYRLTSWPVTAEGRPVGWPEVKP